jgi:antitoxin ParD1/3/4
VEVAIEQLDRGEGIDGEIVVEQLREKLRKARLNPISYVLPVEH